jgi:hypothetical protein
VDVPQSLRGVVHAHEGGWRLHVGLNGVLGLLRRMLWVLVMMIAVAVVAVRSAVAFYRVDLAPATTPTHIVLSGSP